VLRLTCQRIASIFIRSYGPPLNVAFQKRPPGKINCPLLAYYILSLRQKCFKNSGDFSPALLHTVTVYACQLPLLLHTGVCKLLFKLLCNILCTWIVDIISTTPAYLPHSCCATVNSLQSMWATVFITFFFTKQFFSDTCRTFLSPT